MLHSILLVALPFAFIFYLFQQYNQFKHIPGPFLAKFTNLWRLLSVYRRDPQDVECRLHFIKDDSAKQTQCVDVVRLGPNTLSVTGPNYIPQIYGIDKKLRKSDYYAVFQNIVNGRRAASLVAMTDEQEHARTRRQVAHAFSLSTLVEFEVLVDSTTEVFLNELGKRFGNGRTECDFGKWLQYYAFDVIGELTFSKRLGFIETGEDVSDIINSIGKNFDYFSVLGQMPWLDETFLGKNPLYIKYLRRSVSSPILQFAQQLLSERLAEIENGEADEKTSLVDKPDFLSRFLQIREKAKEGAEIEEEPMSDGQLLAFLFANINAGSDTIASTVRAVFYYLLKEPKTLATLMDELNDALASGNLTLPTPTWQETQSEHLPYLRAVIKEALRMNPALSLPLERVVSAQGLTLTSAGDQSELWLPGGTIVGINPYVLHRDPRIFDPNDISPPTLWDPSRWLSRGSGSSNSPEQIKAMDHSLLTFGAGKRSCLGKNIAMLELHKLVPAVLMRFDLRLARPEAQWKVRNGWVLNQTGLDVIPEERSSTSSR